jgi:hypothetical protein
VDETADVADARREHLRHRVRQRQIASVTGAHHHPIRTLVILDASSNSLDAVILVDLASLDCVSSPLTREMRRF